MSTSIMDFWALSTPPRESQIAALEWIEKQDKKYIICDLPVGTGKSAIAATYAHYLSQGITTNGSFILTPQISLQKQYERTFKGSNIIRLASLYGKSNYPCMNHNTTCDIGAILKPKCTTCAYTSAKQYAQMQPHVVLNYKLALLLLAHTTIFAQKRKLMVFDECHNLEQELTEFDAVVIVKQYCERYRLPFKQFSNIKDAFLWLQEVYLPKVEQLVDDLQVEYESIKKSAIQSAQDIKKLRALNRLLEHESTINMLIAGISRASINNELVLLQDKETTKFKRVSAAHSFNTVFKNSADRFLFTSATVLSKDQFCDDIGIDRKDVAFLSIDSEFPKERRPVFFIPTMKMNSSWKNDENEKKRQELVTQIKAILKAHSTESGIIHTGNYAIAKWLTDELRFKVPHEILHHNPSTDDGKSVRGDVIETFQTHDGSTPKLLISPSITEGLDLVGDLARFAIIAKVAFPFLGDAWIKRKMELSQQWYLRQTLIDVIQASGRVVRSADDWGTVYILDESFGYLKQQTTHMIPKWWLDAYRRLDSLDQLN